MYTCGKFPDAGMSSEEEGSIVRYLGKGDEPFFYSLFLKKAPENLDSVIKNEIALAIKRGRSSLELKAFPEPHLPELEELLLKLKFIKQNSRRLMALPISSHLSDNSQVQVKAVTNSDELQILLDINEKVWGQRQEWIAHSLTAEMKQTPCLTSVFLAYIDEHAVSNGWCKLYGKIAYLFGGSTLKEARGKGAYRALVGKRLNWARAQGAEYLVSECTPDSGRILANLGFVDMGVVNVFNLDLKN
jgi:GNAT superfamily N-acetyltransferase